MDKEQIKIPVEGFKISKQLVGIICKELGDAELENYRYAILNFRDPDYSAENGGFHPVEIAITGLGFISYITDFCYVGSHYMAELVKDIDFDFTCQQYLSGNMPIREIEAKALFKLWEDNFCAYYEMGVFTVKKEFN